MSRPMPTTQLSGRPVDFAALGMDRGVTLMMQESFEDPSASGDFLPTPGYERANRLVRPEVAAHYLRQGERIADAITAAHGFFRRVAARFRHRPAGDGRPSIPHAR